MNRLKFTVLILLTMAASTSVAVPVAGQSQNRQTDLAFIHVLLTGGSDAPLSGQVQIRVLDESGVAEVHGVLKVRDFQGPPQTINLHRRSLRAHARLVDYNTDGTIDEVVVDIQPDSGSVDVPNIKLTISMQELPEGGWPVSVELGPLKHDTIGRLKVQFHFDRQ